MWSALTWNILFGGEERFDAILSLLARAKSDVTVLQECLGWEEGDRLSRIAGALGVPYIDKHAMLGHARARPSGRRFHVALISRFPIVQSKTHADPEHVGHVILEARVATPNAATTIFGTHFDSHGEDQRLRDARTLCTIIDPTRQSERLLVAGDLNALSTRDPYPHDLAEKLKSAGTEKYGMPPRFEVMPLLEGHGLVDLRPEPWVTAMRDRGGVRIDYRTDYLLASPALAADCKSVEVIACEGASDHEPVLARFA